MSDSDSDLERIGCTCVVRCDGARVAIVSTVLAEFSELEQRQQDRFKRIMELWCEGRPLTPEMMNRNEGRSTGGIRIEAFKAFNVRLYGFEIKFKNLKTFFIVIIDPTKKIRLIRIFFKARKASPMIFSGEFEDDRSSGDQRHCHVCRRGIRGRCPVFPSSAYG
ncbi:hypothetical protein [Novosphingobium sp. Chol11]|uniref:hypothetical protein n=1 Tax=Novosphingobium sp. Chol11 TaxID=1385763 RepID=UPI0025E798E7|nr:hypothetical protein [Novosphingobium sp. Chol11]